MANWFCCIACGTIVTIMKIKSTFQQMAHRPISDSSVSALLGVLYEQNKKPSLSPVLPYNGVH